MDDIDNLKNTAKKSSMRHRHAAALYDSRGNVICYAYNRRTPNSPHASLHAEEGAIAKFVRAYMPRGRKPHTIRVIRINRVGKLMPSKPCRRCAALIEECGLRVEHS